MVYPDQKLPRELKRILKIVLQHNSFKKKRISSARQIKFLKKQVRILKKQVKSLARRVQNRRPRGRAAKS